MLALGFAPVVKVLECRTNLFLRLFDSDGLRQISHLKIGMLCGSRFWVVHYFYELI